MQVARRNAQKVDGKSLPDEALHVDREDWAIDEIVTQRLFYNIHANEHARLGGKADAAGEALMMQWAAHGVTRVEHVLHHSYRRVQTPHEFY